MVSFDIVRLVFWGFNVFFKRWTFKDTPQEICGLLRDSIHHGGFRILAISGAWMVRTWKLMVGKLEDDPPCCWVNQPLRGELAGFGEWLVDRNFWPRRWMIAKSHAILDSICVVLFWVRQFWGFWKYRRLKLAPKKEARWLWFGLQVSILRLAHWVLLSVVTKWTSGSRLGFIHNED